MKNRSRSLENLQTALEMEMTAMQQYMLHAHVLEDWGLDKLAAKMREEMHEELGHANAFMARMVFLKQIPDVRSANEPHKATSLKDMFESDMKDEQGAIEFYTKAAREAFDDGDIGTKDLFEKIAMDEEGHLGWLELQLDLVERIGEPNFIMHHMADGSAAE